MVTTSEEKLVSYGLGIKTSTYFRVMIVFLCDTVEVGHIAVLGMN